MRASGKPIFASLYIVLVAGGSFILQRKKDLPGVAFKKLKGFYIDISPYI